MFGRLPQETTYSAGFGFRLSFADDPIPLPIISDFGIFVKARYIFAMSIRDSRSVEADLQALLKEVRMESGLRQSDLAERLGQPQSFVSKYESGERRLDILELRQVCQAVGVPLQEFVRRLEERLRK
jgi:predicted transcriptional regulator